MSRGSRTPAEQGFRGDHERPLLAAIMLTSMSSRNDADEDFTIRSAFVPRITCSAVTDAVRARRLHVDHDHVVAESTDHADRLDHHDTVVDPDRKRIHPAW